MNYFGPYGNLIPTSAASSSTGILSSLFGKSGLTLGTVFTNIQKTLGFVNQAIPVVKQVSPMIKNAKTMFKVMNEFKKVDTPTTNNTSNPISAKPDIVNTTPNRVDVEQTSTENNSPTFFV